jgi:hypothetical protein
LSTDKIVLSANKVILSANKIILLVNKVILFVAGVDEWLWGNKKQPEHLTIKTLVAKCLVVVKIISL